MSNNWIIEVLGDLRGFSAMNGLPILAERLEEAIVIAIAEVEQAERPTSDKGPEVGLDDAKVGRFSGAAR